MDAKIKSKTKCHEKYNSGSLVILIISLVLGALLFVRIEVVNRKAEVIEAKLETRLQRSEDEMLAKVQKLVSEILQAKLAPVNTKREGRNRVSLGELLISKTENQLTLSLYCLNHSQLSWGHNKGGGGWG